ATYITTTWNFGDIALPLRLAVPFVGSVLMPVALELFLRKTFIGRAIVAVAPDPFALRLVAVSPVHIKRVAFGIACASAAFAGAFILSSSRCSPPSAASSSGAFSRFAFSAALAACRAPSLQRIAGLGRKSLHHFHRRFLVAGCRVWRAIGDAGVAALRLVRAELRRHDQLALSRRGRGRRRYRLRRRRLAEHRLSVFRRLCRFAIRRVG